MKTEKEIGFIGGMARVGDIKKYGLVEASHKYWSEFKEKKKDGKDI